MQVFGSVLTTGASLVVGKEGSLLHVGSALAHMFAQLAKRFINSRDGNGKPQRGALLRHDMRDLVTVGASVGVCAVFRAPVRLSLCILICRDWHVGQSWHDHMHPCRSLLRLCINARFLLTWCHGSAH